MKQAATVAAIFALLALWGLANLHEADAIRQLPTVESARP